MTKTFVYFLCLFLVSLFLNASAWVSLQDSLVEIHRDSEGEELRPTDIALKFSLLIQICIMELLCMQMFRCLSYHSFKFSTLR